MWYNIFMSSTPESEFDDWFETERGTEIDADEDECDYDSMSGKDY